MSDDETELEPAATADPVEDDVDAPADAAAGRRAQRDKTAKSSRAPQRIRGGRRRAVKQRVWHSGHPVFIPLAGFFTGMALTALMIGGLGWVLRMVLNIDLSENGRYFLYALGFLFVVDFALLIAPRTRRFARYMLAALITTPIVVGAAGALTLYLLLKND